MDTLNKLARLEGLARVSGLTELTMMAGMAAQWNEEGEDDIRSSSSCCHRSLLLLRHEMFTFLIPNCPTRHRNYEHA